MDQVILDLGSDANVLPVHNCKSDDDINCIYKIIVQNEDCVSPKVDGQITLDGESSCTSDFDEELERS